MPSVREDADIYDLIRQLRAVGFAHPIHISGSDERNIEVSFVRTATGPKNARRLLLSELSRLTSAAAE